MRVKKNRDTLLQSYSLYIQDNNNPVDLKTYKTICYAFNKELANLIVDKGLDYELPYRLGFIGIKRRKMKFKKLKFDFQHWKETGEKTFHLNQHSKEWYTFCHWNKKACKVRGKSVYKFTLSRDNKRRIASIMQQENGYQIYQVAPTKIKDKKKCVK